jgi:ParB-like chromosome segregation protein Spo0J
MSDKKPTKRGFADAMSADAKTPRNRSEKSTQSFIRGAVAKPNELNKTRTIEQKRRYELPISKTTVEATLLKLDPKKTIVSPLNPRIQELMDRNDPKLNEMKISFLQNGQYDPVWARPIVIESEVWHEIFVGSTRRFISLWINEEVDSNFMLMAWVADVPDVDAKRMARLENNDRRDLSFWEKCIDAKKNKEDPSVSSLPIEQQAKAIGMSAGAYSEALSAVNIIPPEFIKHLLSPNLMRAKSARRMISKIKNVRNNEDYDKKGFINHVLSVMGGEKAEDVGVLESSVEVVCTTPWGLLDVLPDATILRNQSTSFIEKAALEGVDLNKVISRIESGGCEDIAALKKIVSSFLVSRNKKKPWVKHTDDNEVAAKITPHRTNPGQYKIDLYGIEDEKILLIQELIDKKF